MSFLTRLTYRDNPLESPSIPLSSLANPAGWLLNWSGGTPTDSGEAVTPLTALQVTTIVACVKVIAEGAGQLSIRVLERLKRGMRVAYEHDLYSILSAEPNPEMTAITWIETSLVHALLWGNSYTEIQRSEGGKPVALWPRKPWETELKRNPEGKLVYICTDSVGQKARTIDPADMIHVPGLSLDGWVGIETIKYARQAIGLAMAQERHGARFFGNGAQTSGTIEVPGEMTDGAYQRLKTSMEAQMTGSNKFRAMMLEGGAKWNQTSSPNDQAQFVESRRLQRSELAALFRVPLFMISSDDSKGVKSNTEQIAGDFLSFGLMPWLIKYQQEFNRKLFPKVGRNANKHETKFHIHGLMAADSSARMDFYTRGSASGLLSINDCLELEDLPLIGPEGDEHFVPLNMTPVAQAIKMAKEQAQAPVTEPAPADEGNPQETKSLLPRLIRAYSPLFTDGFSRLSSRSKKDSTSIRQCLQPSLDAVSSALRDILSFQSQTDLGSAEGTRATEKYLAGLATRTEAIEAPVEITRALKTLVHAAYRDLAVAQAQKALKEETPEDDEE